MTGAELSPPLPANPSAAVSIFATTTIAAAAAAAAVAASTAAHVSLSPPLCKRVSVMSTGRLLEINSRRALGRRRHRTQIG